MTVELLMHASLDSTLFKNYQQLHCILPTGIFTYIQVKTVEKL